MTTDPIDALLDELDALRAPRCHYSGRLLPRGARLGPYRQGAPERGYGGPELDRIREIRRELARYGGLL